MTTLFPTYILGELRLTSYPYAVEFGGDHGAPETITELVQSLLADGDIVRVTRHGNREISFVVHVEGASLAEVAQNEAALRRECAKLRNLLTFEPGDEMDAPASVFEVHVAEMRQPRDDEMEQHLIRRWELTLTCGPHAMSAETTTITALSTGTTSTTIDTCDSITGWSGTRSGSPTGVALRGEPDNAVGVFEFDSAVTAPETWTLTRTGSVDFTSTPYLVAQVATVSTNTGTGLRLTAKADGVSLPLLSSRKIADGSDYFTVTFDASALSVVGSITFTHTTPAGQPWQSLYVRDLARTDIAPSVTARQVTRILDAGGTERTPVSIRVSSTSSLGLSLVHTSPEDGSGYSPPLRRWRTSGNTVTTDASTVSGGYELIHPNPVQYKVPTSSLPEGGYLLCAFLRVGIVGDHSIYFSSYTRMPAPNESVYAGEVVNRVTVNFPVANTWQLVPLGIMTLPTVRTKAGSVYVGIQRDSTSLDDILIDEAWLFRVDDDCALSIANATASNLWLDSPGIGFPVQTMWMGGTPETRTNPGDNLVVQGNHVLHPDGTAVFAATLGTQWPEVSGTFRRRWHSNAAE